MNPDENNANTPGEQPAAPNTPPIPNTPIAPEASSAPAPTPTEPVPAEPEAPIAPEASAEPEAPNLDQVAADLANAAPADVAPDATPAEPVAPATPAVEQPAPFASTPEDPATPESSAIPEVSTTPDTSTMPEAPIMSEAPATPDVSTAPVAPGTPEVPPMTPEVPVVPEVPTTPEASSTDYSTGASFIDDAQNPDKPTETKPEDEEPLVPAEPVPGSIGSALAYSDTAPNHAVPVGKASKFKLSFGKKSTTEVAEPVGAEGVKPGRKPLTKENLKLLIAVIGGVTLVAVVAVVIFFIINSGSKSSTTKPAENSNNDTPTNTVTSLTCTLEGDASAFSAYGNVVSGSDQIIAMYSNDNLSSFGTTLELTFADEDSAKSAQLAERERYNSKIKSAGLTEDPFTSSYDVSDSVMTITHQAEGDDIDSENAEILDFYVIKGEPQTDIDTLLDAYETDGYTCIEK